MSAALTHFAKQTHLAPNNEFSLFLADQFKQMDDGDTPVRAIYLMLPTHAIGVILRTYINSAKEKIYSVQFMEPNVGESSPVHCKVTDIEQLRKSDSQLVDYICGSNGSSYAYDQYYSNADDDLPPCFIACVWDQAGLTEFEQTGKVENRQSFSNQLAPAPLHVSFNMDQGNAAYFIQLKNKVATLSQHDLYKVLNGDRSYAHKPMKLAMQNGSADAIKAYGELVKLITDKQVRSQLLFPESDRTEWARCALYYGHVNAAIAWAEVVNELL